MPLQHSVSITYTFLRQVVAGNKTRTDQANLSGSAAFAEGAGAMKVNAVYGTGEVTLGAAANVYDLAGGGLVDGTGGAFSVSRLKSFCLVTPGTNVGNVTVGGGTNPFVGAWGTTLVLPPGTKFVGQCVVAAGWPVVAGTGDTIQVAGTAGDKFELYLAGE